MVTYEDADKGEAMTMDDLKLHPRKLQPVADAPDLGELIDKQMQAAPREIVKIDHNIDVLEWEVEKIREEIEQLRANRRRFVAFLADAATVDRGSS